MPNNTQASLCDTLTITNLDNKVRLMAFGSHDYHVAYDGTTETPLEKNQSLQITLIQTGSFIFHDHLGDVAKGSFRVR